MNSSNHPNDSILVLGVFIAPFGGGRGGDFGPLSCANFDAVPEVQPVRFLEEK